MSLKKSLWLALLGGVCLTAGSALAQDSGPLIDLLVKKGIVNDQEAEDLRVALVKDFAANTSAGKLNLSSSLVEFKLSGDLRMRYESNAQVPELATGAAPLVNETSRQRFRFRFNGDVILQKGWNAGFALETGQSNDSANQTFTSAADDYGVYVARAYVGWSPNTNWSFVLGKQKNPFYTTEMRWDADISPQGVSELYKYFIGAKDTFELRAMQHAMEDRAEATPGPAGRDTWMFEQQAVYTHWFAPGNLSSLIVAAGYSAYNQSTITAFVAPNSAPYVGSVRAQNYGTLAGEVNLANVNGAGTAFKIYWDSSYNFTGATRAYKVYNLNPAVFSKGSTAWLAGIGYSYGTGKVQGDYSAKLDYREVGVTAVDPNTNDSDWGFSKTNQKGLKLALTYNVTDFVNFNVTYFDTKIMQEKMTFALGNLNRSHELLVDLVVKF
ncbi:MAG: putative porin [Undibacterium sp.]|nr:putative porin [Opitutaceae bacterium]